MALHRGASEVAASAKDIGAELNHNLHDIGSALWHVAEGGTPHSPKRQITQRDKRLQEVVGAIRAESMRYADLTKHPWQDLEGNSIWPTWRIYLAKMLMSQWFETIMGIVILCNVAAIVVESDNEAACYPDHWDPITDSIDKCPTAAINLRWLVNMNIIFLVIYTLEVSVGLVTFRKGYFEDWWNCLDIFVVVTGIGSEALSGNINVAYLRLLRMFRLVRTFRIFRSIRELYLLISGLFISLKAMTFGMILLLVMLGVWGIILVEFVHPTNAFITYPDCERCSRAYKTVAHTTLTLFQQVVAGDSWGTPSIRLIEERPILAIVLVMTVGTISLCVMNLILAVIVDSAAEARENDMAEKTRRKQKQLVEQKIKLLNLCAAMDQDDTGSISMDEIVKAWEVSDEFHGVMVQLGVQRDDLVMIFKLLDTEGDGDVEYKEFVDQLYQLCTGDVRMMIANMRLSLQDHVRDSKGRYKSFEAKMSVQEGIRSDVRLLLERQGAGEVREPQARAGDSNREGETHGSVDSSGAISNGVPPSSKPPLESTSPVASMAASNHTADPVSNIASLRAQLQELVNSKVDIMCKAEEHETMLLNHAEVLSLVHASMLDWSSDGKAREELVQNVGLQVSQLRHHVEQRLAPALQELGRRVDEEAATVQGSGRIIDKVTNEMKLPPAPGLLPASLEARKGRASRAGQVGVEAAPPPKSGTPRLPSSGEVHHPSSSPASI